MLGNEIIVIVVAVAVIVGGVVGSDGGGDGVCISSTLRPSLVYV